VKGGVGERRGREKSGYEASPSGVGSLSPQALALPAFQVAVQEKGVLADA